MLEEVGDLQSVRQGRDLVSVWRHHKVCQLRDTVVLVAAPAALIQLMLKEPFDVCETECKATRCTSGAGSSTHTRIRGGEVCHVHLNNRGIQFIIL